jgi:5-methyltetrahydrofolate--homocysteine methyltransferase
MTNDFLHALRERVLIFDGAMGTAIQARNLHDDDFWGKEGCNERLVLSRPDVIRDIHLQYLATGVDAIETNSFGANAVVLAEYDLLEKVYELNFTAAQLARSAAREFSTHDRPRWVSGAMGPGTKLPTLGHIRYDALRENYAEQAQGLIDGGVDLLQIETCQDLLQAKAAVAGAELAFQRTKRRVPIVLQVTIEAFGTMLLGSDISAALTALEPLSIDVIGLNCATGPAEMGEHVRYLGQHSRKPISVLPNAGLPVLKNDAPFYPLSPEDFVKAQRSFVEEYGVNLVGGCCGTTEEHIAALVSALWGRAPLQRQVEHEPACASLFTSVPLEQDTSFLVVGERLNANGSRQFRQMLLADDYDAMLGMMKQQMREGAHLLDLNVDYVGRDGVRDMDEVAIRLADKSTQPLMIDSTEPAVLEAALKRLGGRAVINSINLEDGEARMDKVMPMARQYGAALVALCIDEEGQARTADWKVRVARRIYDLVTQKWGLAGSDLIFDPLTMPIATGQEEVRRDGIETIEAIKRIKTDMPDAYTILGVSNVSFGLKPAARQVLNSVFLHYAVEAGLDAAIVNPQKILPLHKIDQHEREVARQLIFDERGDGYDPLVAFMQLFNEQGEQRQKATLDDLPVEQRLKSRIVDGERKGLEKDLDEALQSHEPLAIINEVLLDGMKVVGDLFASGEMQLPFVLQSAETMKAAVGHLEPLMDRVNDGGRGKIVLGTVKGDVHDIGKNLADIILSNNGYTVYNLGIKQPLQAFVDAAEQNSADAIGMSGLLVKSTVVMKENLIELNDRSLSRYPVLLGGAALTRSYVEHDLRTLYRGQVFYCQDAFEGLRTMDAIVHGEGHVLAARAPKAGQAAEAEQLEGYQRVETFDEASELKLQRSKAFVAASAVRRNVPVPTPPFWGARVAKGIPLPEVYAFINEVALFRAQWGYSNKAGWPKERYEAFLDDDVRPIYRQWQYTCQEEQLLIPQVVYGYFPCQSSGNDIIIYDVNEGAPLATLTFPRQISGKQLCLADYFRSVESGERDVIALQLATMGDRARKREAELFKCNQYTDYLHLHGFSVEATEALAELWHKRVREELGIAADDAADIHGILRNQYQGARFSFGYPACPEREHDAVIARLLQPERIGVALTDEWMWDPEQSTSALVVHHPDGHYFNVL